MHYPQTQGPQANESENIDMGSTAPGTTSPANKAGEKSTDSKAPTSGTSATAPANGATSAPATKETTTVDPDRGNIGAVLVRPSTREFTSSRSKTTTNPVHLAVKAAVKGTAYDLVVDKDDKKIERVKRMLRAAAQNYDVGMSIHPDAIDVEGMPGKVLITFKTGDRDHRKDAGENNTTADTTKTDAKDSGAANKQ